MRTSKSLPVVMLLLISVMAIGSIHLAWASSGGFIAHYYHSNVSSPSSDTVAVSGVVVQSGDFVLAAMISSSNVAVGSYTVTDGTNTWVLLTSGIGGGFADTVYIYQTTASSSATLTVTAVSNVGNQLLQIEVTVWRGYDHINQGLGGNGGGANSITVTNAHIGSDLYGITMDAGSSSTIVATTSGWIEIQNLSAPTACCPNADGYVHESATSTTLTWTNSDNNHPNTAAAELINKMTFTLSISPGSATLAPSSSTSPTVTVHFVSGNDETVNLVCSGLPGGVSCSSVGCNPGATTCGITLTMTSTASPEAGTYTVTITGATNGGGSATTTFALTVTGNTFYNRLNPGSSVGTANAYDIVNSLQDGSTASVGAEYSTTWVGKTLTSVTIDLGWDTTSAGTCVPTGSYNVGIFDGSSGSTTPVVSLGTGTLVSLPRVGYTTAGTASRLTFTASHMMAANEVIGVTASDSSASCSGGGLIAGVSFFFMSSSVVPGGKLDDFYAGSCPTINDCGDSSVALSASFSSGGAPPPPPPGPALKGSVMAAVGMMALMVVGLVTVAIKGSENGDPVRRKALMALIVATVIVITILVAAGI